MSRYTCDTYCPSWLVLHNGTQCKNNKPQKQRSCISYWYGILIDGHPTFSMYQLIWVDMMCRTIIYGGSTSTGERSKIKITGIFLPLNERKNLLWPQYLQHMMMHINYKPFMMLPYQHSSVHTSANLNRWTFLQTNKRKEYCVPQGNGTCTSITGKPIYKWYPLFVGNSLMVIFLQDVYCMT